MALIRQDGSCQKEVTMEGLGYVGIYIYVYIYIWNLAFPQVMGISWGFPIVGGYTPYVKPELALAHQQGPSETEPPAAATCGWYLRVVVSVLLHLLEPYRLLEGSTRSPKSSVDPYLSE